MILYVSEISTFYLLDECVIKKFEIIIEIILSVNILKCDKKHLKVYSKK